MKSCLGTAFAYLMMPVAPVYAEDFQGRMTGDRKGKRICLYQRCLDLEAVYTSWHGQWRYQPLRFRLATGPVYSGFFSESAGRQLGLAVSGAHNSDKFRDSVIADGARSNTNEIQMDDLS